MVQHQGLVVIITGCSSGIGKALAEEFSERGHRVLATARRPDSISDLASQNLKVAGLDVTDVHSIEHAVGECLAWTGKVDMVVNNAGYALIGPVAEIDLNDLRSQFETNVIGLVAVAQAVVPHMVRSGGGRIVNIGSVSGLTATPFGGAYSATKAAVHMLSDALRMEVAPFGIEVVTIQPGSVQSSFGNRAAVGVPRYREDSLYESVAGQIAERAGASQVNAMPARKFAARVVAEVTAERPRAVFRDGKHSRVLPTLARLPVWLRDRILSRRFKLERLQ